MQNVMPYQNVSENEKIISEAKTSVYFVGMWVLVALKFEKEKIVEL